MEDCMKEVPNPLSFWPVLAGSTFLSTPGVKGMIIEQRTGKPVIGARIYAVWKRRLRSQDGQVFEETAKKVGLITAEDGCFEIPPYFLFNPAPGPEGHAGSFAFMVYADEYKVRLYTFRDPESLTSYESYDWRELAPVSQEERMIIRLSKISDSAITAEGRDEPECRLADDCPEAARTSRSPLNGYPDRYYPLGHCRAVANKLDTAQRESRPVGGHIRERVMRARKKLAEDSEEQ
jgi:hypothetical protein